jgi:hypothetical protein
MSIRTVGRVPIMQAGPLLDPYDKDLAAIIEPAEDFTISINYISSQLFHRYKSLYKAGEFDNDYFALLSQSGIGDTEKPVLKVQYLCANGEMQDDKETIWGENIAVVEDFLKNMNRRQASERIYLSFCSLCRLLAQLFQALSRSPPLADLHSTESITLSTKFLNHGCNRKSSVQTLLFTPPVETKQIASAKRPYRLAPMPFSLNPLNWRIIGWTNGVASPRPTVSPRCHTL